MSRAAIATAPCCAKPAVPATIKKPAVGGLIPLLFAAAASALLLISLKLPLWQMRLEAPQYRDQEALHIAVLPHSMRGDLRELSVLDKYIGVHVPSTLPQFKWLPALLIAGAVAGFAGAFWPALLRRRVLTLVSCTLAAALACAAVQAMQQMRDIGHQRDQKTALIGVKDFTPPFLGTSKIAQFSVSSSFGLGSWLIAAGLVLQLGADWCGRRTAGKTKSRLSAVQS
jgi:hypothetical protein